MGLLFSQKQPDVIDPSNPYKYTVNMSKKGPRDTSQQTGSILGGKLGSGTGDFGDVMHSLLGE